MKDLNKKYLTNYLVYTLLQFIVIYLYRFYLIIFVEENIKHIIDTNNIKHPGPTIPYIIEKNPFNQHRGTSPYITGNMCERIRSVNQFSSNNQWVNSLADMFRGLFLSSVSDRISNPDITN